MTLAYVVAKANGLVSVIYSLEVYELCTCLRSFYTAKACDHLRNAFFCTETITSLLQECFCLSDVYVFHPEEGLKSNETDSIVGVLLEVSFGEWLDLAVEFIDDLLLGFFLGLVVQILVCTDSLEPSSGLCLEGFACLGLLCVQVIQCRPCSSDRSEVSLDDPFFGDEGEVIRSGDDQMCDETIFGYSTLQRESAISDLDAIRSTLTAGLVEVDPLTIGICGSHPIDAVVTSLRLRDDDLSNLPLSGALTLSDGG